jgi:hypothetical protein
VSSLLGCSSKKEAPIDIPYTAPTAVEPPAKSDDVLSATTLATAIDRSRSKLANGGRAPSEGAKLLADWAATHLAWEEIDLARPETSLALAARAPEAEIGKRLCEQGEVLEIRSTTDGGRSLGLMTKDQKFIYFLAVRGAGALAPRSSARLCGVVTGKAEHSGADGKTVSVIEVVGMFDLPDNRRPLAPPVGPAEPGRPGRVPGRPGASGSPSTTTSPTGRSVSSAL